MRASLALLGIALSVRLPAAAIEPDPQAVAEVAAGKRSEARASWWGFDPVDATAALQAAINSGARKLTVEDMGAAWVTDKLELAGNQEIVFEKGVVVQAKRGAFRGGGDCLFSAALKTNITLIGPATFRMWKQDYDDKTRYTRAEWRHVLSFMSCARVRVEGLTLADSGGDGIYLGVAQQGVPCSDVVIRNVTCLNNYRQGISVISARNLLIEDCTLKGTGGTAPEAGIDFEPNEASEELVNCVMRNCISENNNGDAYTFYLRPLRAESKPISLRLENCRAIGSRRSVSFVTGNDSDTAGVKGTLNFINCRFEGSRQAAIVIGDKPEAAARVAFANCEIVNPAVNSSDAAPIEFTSGPNAAATVGGVAFEALAIRDDCDRLPMSYQDLSGDAALRSISGTLTVSRGAQQTVHRLTPQLIARWMPHSSFREFARIDTAGWRYEPVFPDATPDATHRSAARQRGTSEWLVWAEAGQAVSFNVLVQRVGNTALKPVPVSLLSPSGNLTKMPAAHGDTNSAYDFQASERGAFKIVCEPQGGAATVNSPGGRVCLYSRNGRFHLLGAICRFWFRVPAGTTEFAVKVSGGGGAESVKAALHGPNGQKVEEKDNIVAHQFLVTRPDVARDEIWSLQFDKPGAGVLEDFYVQLQGIPPLISPAREGLLEQAD